MDYPAETVEEILRLPTTPETFLRPSTALPASAMDDFSVEASAASIDGAMLHDERFSKWLPKLVPRRVDEEAFWRNYFSHVQAILMHVHPHRSSAAGAAGAGAATTEEDDSEEEDDEEEGRGERYPAVDAAAVAAAAGVAAPAGVAAAAAAAAEKEGGDGDGGGNDDDLWREDRHPTPKPPPAMDPPPSKRPASAPDSTAAAAAAVEADGFLLSDLELLPEPPLEVDQRGLGRPIRWGIIGCGSVCELKAGPAFQKAAGSKLVAVMRRTPELARDFARRHGVPKCYTDVDQLVHDPEVDAVYVATPPGSHHDLALKVCQAGKPCLVEKPMARHFEECRLMLSAFDRVNVPLYVAFYRRRHDRFVKAKQIVRRFLGTVTSVECVLTRGDHLGGGGGGGKKLGWRADPERSGGGLFLDLGSHTLDILDFLLGPLDRVSGDATRHASAADGSVVETGVSMTFRTPGGAVGVAVWDFCSAIYQDRLTIKGTKASLVMSVFGAEGPKLFLPSGKSVQYRNSHPEHAHQPLIEDIVMQLRGGSVPAERLSTGESAERTARVMDAVLRKFYRSRSDAFWQRPGTYSS